MKIRYTKIRKIKQYWAIGPCKIFFWTDLKSDGGQGMIHQDITYYDRAPKDKGNISGIYVVIIFKLFVINLRFFLLFLERCHTFRNIAIILANMSVLAFFYV